MAERGNLQNRFELGFEYYSPFKPPSKAPEGYRWECSWRHPEKDYPERWRLVPLEDREDFSQNLNFPKDNPYGVDPKKMERDWERATSKKGRPPIGGAQDD